MNWIADHLDEPDWNDLDEKVTAVSRKLMYALDAVNEALGYVDACEMWKRLEACAAGGQGE